MDEQSRRIAILQPCYVPWKGYFDIIGSVDTFVVYDDVQYSKNHWYNRNLIKAKTGLQWLTIPVSTGASSSKSIQEVRVDQPFAHKHRKSLEQSYSKAPYFLHYREWLEQLYNDAAGKSLLLEVNLLFLKAICAELGVQTQILRSSEMGVSGGQTERLVNICRELKAHSYLSGPSAKDYLDVSQFQAANVDVEWMDYSRYVEYKQLHGGFEHTVTILDLLFNTGPDASKFMKWPGASTNRAQS